MEPESNYLEINRNSWNNRTDTHLKSEFYDLEGFLKGATSLKSIELDLLGDVKNKSILHLQCHFGQDSLSLARMGAIVTGIDLSDKAIGRAKELCLQTELEATFICCDLYSLPEHLDQQFDIVFTSYGTIGWLPNLDRWASVVSKFLKPNGKFVFVEFHPVVWMFDDDFEKVGYNYFNTGAILESETGTYADREAPIQQNYVCWNHGLGEVITSIVDNALTLESLTEYDYSPYNCFKHTQELEPGKFIINHLENKIPMVFSITAIKKG